MEGTARNRDLEIGRPQTEILRTYGIGRPSGHSSPIATEPASASSVVSPRKRRTKRGRAPAGFLYEDGISSKNILQNGGGRETQIRRLRRSSADNN